MTRSRGRPARDLTLRYLAVATWMGLALAVAAATLVHVAAGRPLDLSTAYDWIASIAQVGAFLIVAVHWHEQLVLIDTLSRRMEAAERRHVELLDQLAARWETRVDDAPATDPTDLPPDGRPERTEHPDAP